MIRVICPVKQYDWGALKEDSGIYDYFSGHREMLLDEEDPFAELWMGTHVRGPSRIATSGEPLSHDLPYLFKILNVRKPLSIQIHPSAAQASLLHAHEPTVFPDPFPKPERAIALTPTSLLYGLVSEEEWKRHQTVFPSMKAWGHSLDEALYHIVGAPFSVIGDHGRALHRELDELVPGLITAEWEGKVELFRCEYPDHTTDRGILFMWLMNWVDLAPGQSVSIACGVPHAYLFGDLVEGMLPSDNVIRMGFTSKETRPDLFASMIDRKASEAVIEEGVSVRRSLRTYPPSRGVDGFVISRLVLGNGEAETIRLPGQTMLIVHRGACTSGNPTESTFLQGDVFYVGAEETVLVVGIPDVELWWCSPSSPCDQQK